MQQAFTDWWLGQLQELIPEGLRARMHKEMCVLVLEVQRDSVAVSYVYRNRENSLGSLPLNSNDATKERMRALLSQMPSQPDRILVRLSQELYLNREVELPLAAEESLDESIGFQMEQLTPFSADQVKYFCGIRERKPEHKKLTAWLVAAPLKQLDRILHLLGDPTPTPIPLPLKAPPANEMLELPYRPFGKSESGTLKSVLALGVALMASLVLAAYLHVQNKHLVHRQLGTAVQEIRKEANEAATLSESIDKLKAQSRQLEQYRAQAPQLVALWDDLTQRLDDDTWLQRIDLRNGNVVLHGLSGNAATLIEQLEASPYLKNVRFNSSVTRDRSTSKDRFSITSALVTGGEQGAS